MKYCVYCHTNKKNNKKYIGITCQIPERRWRNGKGYVNNLYFYRSIEKYGWHNFSHEILYNGLSKKEAEALEIKLIKEYDSANPQKGYNIELGGNGTEKFSDEAKRKISNALKGHPCSEETKRKISESRKGKGLGKHWKMKPEDVEKNRLSHIGQKPWNKGKRWADEDRAKFGGKAVYCVELNKSYRTAHEASRELNIDFSSICKCAKGKVKTAGKYHWRYSNEQNSNP